MNSDLTRFWRAVRQIAKCRADDEIGVIREIPLSGKLHHQDCVSDTEFVDKLLMVSGMRVDIMGTVVQVSKYVRTY